MGINSNLQILRAFAASLIVLVHINELLLKDGMPFWLSASLFAGVDVFFVISGFIIHKSVSSNKYTAVEFAFQRWLRVAPLYYFFTVAIFAIAYIYPSLLKSSTTDWVGFVKSITFFPYEKSPGRLYPLYYVGWSLNYEMFFYFLCCIKILFFRYVANYFVELTVFVFVIFGCLIPPNVIYDYCGVFGYFFSRPIMISFVFGMLIARFEVRIISFLSGKNLVNMALILMSVVFILISQLYFPIGGQSAFLPDTASGYYFSIPSAIITISFISLNFKNGFFSNFLVKLGDASYSLYLSHYFVVAIIGLIVDKLFQGYYVLYSLIAFLIAIAVSRFVYINIERKLSILIRTRLLGVSQ